MWSPEESDLFGAFAVLWAFFEGCFERARVFRVVLVVKLLQIGW
jgi:hypothetical protein